MNDQARRERQVKWEASMAKGRWLHTVVLSIVVVAFVSSLVRHEFSTALTAGACVLLMGFTTIQAWVFKARIDRKSRT